MIEQFGFYWSAFSGIILIRYLVIAGGAYLLIHTGLKGFIKRRGISLKPPSGLEIWREVRLSAFSALIFALGAAAIMVLYESGNTLLYTEVQQYGLWYVGFSFVAVLILQDTYFYFWHRLLHHPLLFRHFHQGHHASKDPTPWTSFAFDPPEALIQSLFFVGIVFVLPLHFGTAIAVLMTMTLWAVFSHLGFRVFPASWFPLWLSRWLIGPAHHVVHHHRYTTNYGLYFTVWDRLLKTQNTRSEANSKP
ncbi:MAG: sterol desaturase family protein [Synechococcales bacterium]|nr:sterol desaturase family protein [Synechococcales bacterium]